MSISDTTNGLVRGTGDADAALSDKSAVRVSVMGQQGSTSTRKQTTVNDYGVAPAYSWGIGQATQLNLSGLIQHNNDRPDYGVSPLNGAPSAVGYNTVYGYSDDRTIQDITAVSAELKHRFDGGWLLRDQVQFNGVNTDARETATQGLGTVTAKGFAPFTPVATSALPLSQMYARLQSHDRVIHDTSLV